MNNNKPIKVFVGSSSERSPIANAIILQFEHFASKVRVSSWQCPGLFTPSNTVLDDLVKIKDIYDFGIFIFTPDDFLKTRGEELAVVRDNVLFELGLFIGKMGIERNFIVVPDHFDFKIPSDLLGRTLVTYNAQWFNDDPDGAMEAPCIKIKGIIERLGKIKSNDYSHASAICYKKFDDEYKFLLIHSEKSEFKSYPKGSIPKDKDDVYISKNCALREGGVYGKVIYDLNDYEYLNSSNNRFLVSCFAIKVTKILEPQEIKRVPSWYTYQEAMDLLLEGRGEIRCYEEIIKPLEKLMKELEKEIES
jgi:hypothetical protein